MTREITIIIIYVTSSSLSLSLINYSDTFLSKYVPSLDTEDINEPPFVSTKRTPANLAFASISSNSIEKAPNKQNGRVDRQHGILNLMQHYLQISTTSIRSRAFYPKTRARSKKGVRLTIAFIPSDTLRRLRRMRNPRQRISIEQIFPIWHSGWPNRIMYRRPARIERN